MDTSPQWYSGPPWIFDLYARNSTGSDVATAHRDQLLAQAIPALTLPVGANSTPAFAPEKNYNMPDLYADKLHWPRGSVEITEVPEWHHGDARDVAYVFIYSLFNEILTISNE
jgi:hypothetical protein